LPQHSFSCQKIDALLDVRRDNKIDVLFLVETWHDSDSVSLQRLRVDGFQVVYRTRPRRLTDTMTTNHGGITAIAVFGVLLMSLDIGVKPETFEFMCVRVVSGPSSCIVAIIYRPGSSAVSKPFFDDLANVLDRLSMFVDPIFFVGDINIRLDRPTDPFTGGFNDVLEAHGLQNCVTGSTHDLGGLLDVVVTRNDLTRPNVEVLDVGLSDHLLLLWQESLARACPARDSCSVTRQLGDKPTMGTTGYRLEVIV